MIIDELKTKISDVISCDGCSAEFYFLLDGGEEVLVKSVDIDGDDQEELAKVFIDSIGRNVLLNDELSLVALSSADDRVNAVYKYDLDDIPVELVQLRSIIDSDGFDEFSFSNDSLSSLKGILVLIGNQQAQLAIYKHQYPISLLKKESSFNLVKLGASDRFEKLDKDVLKINSKFEFMKVDGEYYIFDLKTLERFFGFHEAIKNVAEQGVASIEAADIVEDIEALSERIDDISFSRKLVSSASDSPVLGVIPNNVIVSFSNVHPALRGRFKYSKDGSKFDLRTKKSQDLFLKLLNDDFLQSELTKRYYDSMAKDAVDGEVGAES